jgi:signal peptidase I
MLDDVSLVPANKQASATNVLTDTLQAIVISLVISIVIYLFIATPNQIDGLSMEPTFHNGELVLTNRVMQWLGSSPIGKSLSYDYQRGDIIVFQEPGKPDYIKRIIAVGGDKIGIKNGHVYLNEKLIDEKYLDSSVRTRGASFLQEGDTKTVPEGSYFAMGDNRSNSQDSRYQEVAFVKREYIKGKVVFRYWPLARFGIIETGETQTLN